MTNKPQVTPPSAADIFATIDRQREHLTGEVPAAPVPAEFTVGQVVTWHGISGLFTREVTITAVRNSYLTIMGQGPEDGTVVYDVHEPAVVRGTIYGITPDQLTA